MTETRKEHINKRQVGKRKEELAGTYLVKKGYRILGKNFFTKSGEIDIIAIDGKYLVFIEVKYRSGNKYGYPEESISRTKMYHIRSAARYYMYKNGYAEDIPVRFDVVAILGNNIHHIKNAFEWY